MKRLVIASLFAAGMLGAQAQTFTDNARVRSAEPQYEAVNVPRNECSSQWVTDSRRVDGDRPDRQYGGAIVGGLAGGVLGHQIGGGSGRDAATALGVVLGALTGDHLENRDQGGPYYENVQREVKRCRTVYDTQSRITGYRVTYEYRGQYYTTLMHTAPGNSLPVRVTVDPIEQ